MYQTIGGAVTFPKHKYVRRAVVNPTVCHLDQAFGTPRQPWGSLHYIRVFNS